jgi:hypothetical protein
MERAIYKISTIKNYNHDIQELFWKNKEHKHWKNYIAKPLFEWTIFARMGWDFEYRWKNQKLWHMIYYSAAIELPEYNGSIRIMSRHTRDKKYFSYHSNWKADLIRGTETLDLLTEKSLDYGYKNIWVSREENANLLKYFKNHSKYNWDISYEEISENNKQHILRFKND